MLIAHVIAMATANAVSPGFAANYGQIQAVYWSFAPFYAFLQLFVVVIVWMHGAIGLYSWLVLKPVWRRIGGLVLPVLFAVPILALLGFAQSGQEVLDKLANDPAWRAMILENVGRIAKVDARAGRLPVARDLGLRGRPWLAAFAILAVRILRHRAEAAAGRLRRRHAGERALRAVDPRVQPPERRAARARVLRARALRHLPRARRRRRGVACRRPTDLERDTLARVRAGAGERLACQARVLGEGVQVTRLLPAFADASAARAPQEWVAEQAAPAAESRP